MFWKLSFDSHDGAAAPKAEGRFVLHRHRDALGDHLDLRLESGEHLLGWRIDATAPDGETWASEKGPHPLEWLERDADARRVDAGTYAWRTRDDHGGELVLVGEATTRRVRIVRDESLSPATARALIDALAECGAAPADAPALIADGITARTRATERLLGLGRELDGDGFDPSAWRRALRGMSLDEIHTQLHGFERRFDRLHPPLPVSRPERLPGEDNQMRAGAAMAILRA